MTGDMTKYDGLVFDNAGRLTEKIDGKPSLVDGILTEFIRNNGGDPAAFTDLFPAVKEACISEDYLPENYREFVADEGVVEAIKDVMRRLFGYES